MLGDYTKTVYVDGGAPGISAARLNNHENKTAELDTDITAHLEDYVRQPGYGTTAGSANTYTLTLSPALTAYTAGTAISIKINDTNTGASTISINGLGAKSLLKLNGDAMGSGDLLLDGVYPFRYNGVNFIFQSESGVIITGQTEETLTFGETIAKNSPIHITVADATKLADPSTLPTSTSYGVAFSPDGVYLSVAHSTSPYVTIYKRATVVLKSVGGNWVDAARLGYAKEAGVLDDSKKVIITHRL